MLQATITWANVRTSSDVEMRILVEIDVISSERAETTTFNAKFIQLQRKTLGKQFPAHIPLANANHTC